MTEIVHITPVEVHIGTGSNRDIRTVVIRCPFCNKKHTHGWPLGSTAAPGHRVPHCLSKDKPDTYFIDLPEEKE